MAWPSSFDTFPGTGAQGTSLLTSPDHSADHRTLGSFAGTAERVIGLGLGTPVVNTFFQGIGGGSSQWGTAGTSLTFVNPTINNGTLGTNLYVGGTHNGGVFGTPSVDFISARNAGTGIGFNHSIYPSEGTITDSAGGTFTVDARASQIYYSVMGTAAGNRTLGTPSNLSPYQQLTYAFKSSGSANGTLVWPSIYRFSQDIGTPLLGTGVGWNYYGFRYNSIDSKLDFIGQSKNLI